MGWLVRERKSISWKDQTLDSISAPPLPLIVFFLLLIFLLYFETSSVRQETVEKKRKDFRFGLLLVPLLVFLTVNMMLLRHKMRRYTFGVPRPAAEAVAKEEGNSAAGLLVVLVLVLLMVHYQSSWHTAWFRIF